MQSADLSCIMQSLIISDIYQAKTSTTAISDDVRVNLTYIYISSRKKMLLEKLLADWLKILFLLFDRAQKNYHSHVCYFVWAVF